MEQTEKIKQAEQEGNLHYCPNCKQVQPIELTLLDPDEDTEPDVICCLVCREPIGFIDAL